MADPVQPTPRDARHSDEALPLPDFHHAPGHLFRRALRLHDALWAETVGDTLTPVQYAVLTALALEPGIDQRTLGERAAVDRSTTGELIGRLCARGLTESRPDPEDGRRKLLWITEEGRRLLFPAAEQVRTIGARMLSVLSEEDQQQLIRLLDTVVHGREGSGDR
ncbi:hypothetical protein SUDANB60_06260 (plasmid) [Streptomyces sp. enrichment culture]|uniref:MarR family winged helix-turn-helix transcriptional regulator n=1 Tax=Streptomyces sp. enrichment culture TaxID=1795815 RepID=UPI003F560DDD